MPSAAKSPESQSHTLMLKQSKLLKSKQSKTVCSLTDARL